MIQVKDLSHIPPFSWDKPSVGAVAHAFACAPKDSRQAGFWASTVHRTGYRAMRLHNCDKQDPMKVKLYADALRRKQIPTVLEFAAEAFDKRLLAEGESSETKRWEEHARTVLDLIPDPIVVYPVNEPAWTGSDVWEYQYQFIRSLGYEGKIVNSNYSIQGRADGWEMEIFGDAEDTHLYCGHPDKGYIFDCKYPEWTTRNTQGPDGHEWYEPKSKLDLIVSECGTPYANPQRGESNQAMFSDLLRMGAKMIFPFAFATGPEDYLMGTPVNRDKWAMANDPIGLSSVQWLVCKIHGIPFLRNTFIPIDVVKEELYNTSPTYRALETSST